MCVGIVYYWLLSTNIDVNEPNLIFLFFMLFIYKLSLDCRHLRSGEKVVLRFVEVAHWLQCCDYYLFDVIL